MTDLTAAELELEALLESRLEILGARLRAFAQATQALFAETQELHKTVQAKARRMYIIEDNILRLQGKPGLPHLFTESGLQRRPTAGGIGNNEIEDIKMGVKTLRRKFQAAGAVVSTVGWWRHLKEKDNKAGTGNVVAVPVVPVSATSAAKLSIDTSSAAFEEAQPPSPPASTSPVGAVPAIPARQAVISPKAVLSPTSSSTKKRNTLALQEIFTASPTTKPLHQHYALSPSTERANPALGLCSPPLSPRAAQGPSSTSGNSLMRGLSLRS
ncbi:hypothetical protein BGZ97_011704 [Linnemannia gamsii]|jgi:hypothetical protein|uniref:Uncharacterized protein n=1 Tax=Linnemannia gamsii TaxID=64522 RepID=A0A9P6UUD2_9FUNG|nr:hypothetical protein BGZ97_011704 [Linnemannia gamsii]